MKKLILLSIITVLFSCKKEDTATPATPINKDVIVYGMWINGVTITINGTSQKPVSSTQTFHCKVGDKFEIRDWTTEIVTVDAGGKNYSIAFSQAMSYYMIMVK